MDKQTFRQNELVIVSNDGKAWFEAYYIKKGGNNESGHWCHYGNVAYAGMKLEKQVAELESRIEELEKKSKAGG